MFRSLISASASYSNPVAPKDPTYENTKSAKFRSVIRLMLTPLNRLEIDAILDHLPQRA